MIYETIVVTRAVDDSFHLAPMGIREEEEGVIVAPFRPSRTLDNLLATRAAVVNMTDDVSIFAGCLTGRYDWPLLPAERVQGARLEAALSHLEVEVERVEEDALRPRVFCRVVHRATHRPFRGFNRAQAAVLEAAILVSRLHLLPPERIARELEHLRKAVQKTAGEREWRAWDWLMERVGQARCLEVGQAERGA